MLSNLKQGSSLLLFFFFFKYSPSLRIFCTLLIYYGNSFCTVCFTIQNLFFSPNDTQDGQWSNARYPPSSPDQNPKILARRNAWRHTFSVHTWDFHFTKEVAIRNAHLTLLGCTKVWIRQATCPVWRHPFTFRFRKHSEMQMSDRERLNLTFELIYSES